MAKTSDGIVSPALGRVRHMNGSARLAYVRTLVREINRLETKITTRGGSPNARSLLRHLNVLLHDITQ